MDDIIKIKFRPNMTGTCIIEEARTYWEQKVSGAHIDASFHWLGCMIAMVSSASIDASFHCLGYTIARFSSEITNDLILGTQFASSHWIDVILQNPKILKKKEKRKTEK